MIGQLIDIFALSLVENCQLRKTFDCNLSCESSSEKCEDGSQTCWDMSADNRRHRIRSGHWSTLVMVSLTLLQVTKLGLNDLSILANKRGGLVTAYQLKVRCQTLHFTLLHKTWRGNWDLRLLLPVIVTLLWQQKKMLWQSIFNCYHVLPNHDLVQK